MRLPTRKSEILRQSKGSDGPIYLTRNGIEKIKHRIENIKQELPSARYEVRRTQEMGDLSENAAYQSAKYHLRKLDGDLIRLGEDLKRVVEIDERGQSDVVRLGSTVTLASDTGEIVYQIVGERETDPRAGRISHQSPLGQKLLGCKVGDFIEPKPDFGSIKYKITNIR